MWIAKRAQNKRAHIEILKWPESGRSHIGGGESAVLQNLKRPNSGGPNRGVAIGGLCQNENVNKNKYKYFKKSEGPKKGGPKNGGPNTWDPYGGLSANLANLGGSHIGRRPPSQSGQHGQIPIWIAKLIQAICASAIDLGTLRLPRFVGRQPVTLRSAQMSTDCLDCRNLLAGHSELVPE